MCKLYGIGNLYLSASTGKMLSNRIFPSSVCSRISDVSTSLVESSHSQTFAVSNKYSHVELDVWSRDRALYTVYLSGFHGDQQGM